MTHSPDRHETDCRTVEAQSGADAILTDYVLRFGGRCRECADSFAYGICDHSGLPCHMEPASRAILHVLAAIRYGVKQGFIENPITTYTLTTEART